MSSASPVGTAPLTEDTKTRRELMLEGVLAHLERNIDPQVDDRSLEIWRGLLKSVGSAGIWRAQEELGKCYFFGSHGFVKDGKQAWEWFNKEPYSSGKRDVAGRYQYWLGRCYFERFFFEGRGVGKVFCVTRVARACTRGNLQPAPGDDVTTAARPHRGG